MENAVDALKMAFGMIVFVIAMSATIYLISVATSTSEVLLYAADSTNYYDNIKLENAEVTTRTVSIETIIPTLYRYYKENFAVEIFDKDGNLVQLFDLNIEGKVRKAASTTAGSRTSEQKALLELYGDAHNTYYTPDATNPYLFSAPWIGNTSVDTKTRIDLYVSGGVGYINGTKVDYTLNNLQALASVSDSFTEIFSQYAYKGDTITSEDGTESITGNVQTETKIVITYKQQ